MHYPSIFGPPCDSLSRATQRAVRCHSRRARCTTSKLTLPINVGLTPAPLPFPSCLPDLKRPVMKRVVCSVSLSLSLLIQLAVAILVMKWIRYFLPCLIGCVVIPASICCMPCVVRVLEWLYVQQEISKGAQQDEIDTIPTGTAWV